MINTDKSVLIDQTGLHLYDNSPTVLQSLNNFKNFSAHDLILTAPEDNGVYSLLSHQIPEFLSPKLRRRLIKTIQSYHTMTFQSLKELTELFHRVLGHPDLSTMLLMANSSSFTSWPKELSPSVIRKYFPTCSDCPIGNLAERPLLSVHVSSDLHNHSEVGQNLKSTSKENIRLQMENLSEVLTVRYTRSTVLT